MTNFGFQIFPKTNSLIVINSALLNDYRNSWIVKRSRLILNCPHISVVFDSNLSISSVP